MGHDDENDDDNVHNTEVVDYLKRDNKRTGGENYAKSVVTSMLTGLVGFPLAVGVGMPIALAYHGVKAIGRMAQGRAAIEKRPWPPASALEPIDMNKPRKPLQERKYDIVLIGVTGFTGKLAAEYVARQYGTGIKWAIAGRRENKLKQVRDDLVKNIDSNLADLPLIVADTSDYQSLEKLVCDTRVVCTTVGPFAVYGTLLVKACVEYGCSYCDITGEVHWHQVLIDKFDDAARETGAAIVSFCGHDSVPWSLLTLMCTKRLKDQYQRDLKEIRIYNELRSGPSGGTLATVLESFPPPQYTPATGFDPFRKLPDGTKAKHNTKLKPAVIPWYSKEHGSWTGFFLMASVNGKVVQRDNALLGYGDNVTYTEVEAYPHAPAAFTRFFSLPIMGAVMALPPLRNSLLPSPGQGISREEMEKGYLRSTAYATGTGGAKVAAQLYFPVDPGYKDTARMLVESGLSIALQRDRLHNKSGVMSPGACQGEVLLERLLKTGTEMQWLQSKV